jgi:Uma2 family endonuclease
MAITKKEKENISKVRKGKKETSKTDFISEDEYLRREFLAETKSEYHAGKTVAMAGATYNHGLLISRVSRHLGNCLEEENCEVITNDMLVHIPKCEKYCYPDVVVVCEKPEFAEKKKGRSEAITNPQIVIEVLSKGTAEYDMGEKMECYLTLESLQQYFIVSSQRKFVIGYTKDKDGDFKVKTYSENDDVLIGECKIPIEKIYNKVGFEVENDDENQE